MAAPENPVICSAPGLKYRTRPRTSVVQIASLVEETIASRYSLARMKSLERWTSGAAGTLGWGIVQGYAVSRLDSRVLGPTRGGHKAQAFGPRLRRTCG